MEKENATADNPDGVASRTHEGRPVILTAEKRYKIGDRHDDNQSYLIEEVSDPKFFEGPVAKVRRSYGATVNMGNFESVRFDVSVEVPCYVEDIDSADELARRMVDDRISREMIDARAEKKRRGGHGAF